MADAYRLKADASFPRVVRTATTNEGVEIDETTGQNYAAGDFLLVENMTKRDQERAENGELDHLLEEVSLEEAQNGLALVERGLFIPEHEAEAVVLETYGHEIVPKDQVLELKSAGSGEAREALELSKEDGADERPNLTLAEFPSLAEVSNDLEGGVNNVPAESEHVSEERLAEAPSASARGVEQPPGVPVGADKESAEQVTEVTVRKRAGRPKKNSAGGDSDAKQQQVAKQAAAKQEKKD